MVWEDMESLPIIDIIGTVFQNFLQPEKIAPEVSTYDFEVVLIYIFVETWNL